MLKQELFITEFEKQEFNFCDTEWWPLIKIQTDYQLYLKNTNIFIPKDIGKSFNEIEVKITFKDNLRFYWESLKRCKPIKNIILTDSSHEYNAGSKESANLNPFTDPFIHYFEKLKIDYIVFDYKEEEFLLGYDLKIIRKVYLERVKYEFNKNSKIKLQLKQFCSFLSQQYGSDFKLYNHLVQNIITNQVEYLTYSFVLRKGKIKNVLLYCYYNNTMMSIIRAANKLNIETIEYQHSQINIAHAAYSNWNIAQKEIKDFFPSKIWVWRQDDAEFLANQFQDIKKIDYLVGGNLSLESSTKEKTVKTDSYTRVLITLQGIGLPDYIVNCLDRRPNVIFYLRLHPRYPQDKEICEKLKLKYKEQIEMDSANSLTLYELFNFVDYHLTNFSGSAIEAEYFDVTNIIYGDIGYLSYENEIIAGKYLFINSQDDLDLIFEQRLKHKSTVREKKNDIYKLIKENFN